MRRKDLLKLILAGMLSVILLVGMSACGSNSGSSEETDAPDVVEEEEEPADESVGTTAPDFEVELADGTTMSLSDAEGKVVLLNFWATWCGPCTEEMPALQHLYDDYNATKVQILAINCGETKGEVDTFISDNGYTFPIAYDEEGTLSTEQYPTDGIPYTVIIDQKGKIVDTFLGSDGADAQYEKYKAAIDKALGE